MTPNDPPPVSIDLETGIAEIDIFAGRPNPRWLLSEVEREDLLNELSQLPTHPPIKPPTHLGYRGVRANLSNMESATTESIWVYNGKIIHFSGDTILYLEDTDRKVEYQLIELAEMHIDATTYSVIVEQMP